MYQFYTQKKAFTMVELVFVIVVIGILAAIAVPKLAVTRDDAVVVKTRTTVASVRSSLATERQKRILRGEFWSIYKLSAASGNGVPIFNAFDGNTTSPVLQYPLTSCATASSSNCWKETVTGAASGGAVTTVGEYTFYFSSSSTAVFQLKDNRFECKSANDAICKDLTK